ncbi:MAG: FmdB family zinc ribbon protein [Candidatus Angelobacter sp.]
MSSRLPIGVATTYNVPRFVSPAILNSISGGKHSISTAPQCAAGLNLAIFSCRLSLLKSGLKQLPTLRVSCVPLYEYQCKKCKHKFEKIQKFSDRAIKKCPECGSPVEKVMHAPSVQFKGSGWYVTDYAGKKSGTPSSDGASEKADKKESTGAKETAEPKETTGAKDKDTKSRKSESKKAKE